MGKKKIIIIALSSFIIFLVAIIGIKYVQIEMGVKSAINKQYEEVGVDKVDKVKGEERFDRIVHLTDGTKVPVMVYVSEEGGYIVDEVGLIESDEFERKIEGDTEEENEEESEEYKVDGEETGEEVGEEDEQE